MSAKSKIINNVRYITTKVASKPVTILDASIRSDLLFDDADGIDFMHNQAIFDVIKLMGYEGDLTVLTFNKALFSPQWRFLFHTMSHCISSKSTSWDQIPTNIATVVICLATNQKYNFSKLILNGMMRHLDAKKKFVMYLRFILVFLDKQLKNVPMPLDHFPINALTSKVFSFMVKKGKHFSGNVTHLFESMLVQPTEDEGKALERQSKPQPTPSPPHLKGSGGNHGGQSSSDRSLSGNEDGLTLQSVYDLCVSLCKHVTDQAKETKHLKEQIKKLKKKAKPVITHHKAWMKSGRKHAKVEPTVHKDPTFDDFDDIVDDAMDYMESEDAQDEGRTSFVPEVSIAKPKEVEVSTDKLDEGTAKPKDGTSDESTAPTTVFRDDETIAEFLVSMSQNKAKQKGVEIKDAEDSDRPKATSTRLVLTLKPLPKINPKDKDKKVLKEEAESDAESKGVDEVERKFDQLTKDEEVARKVQEDWEAEEEMKKLAEEEATKAALIQDLDDIQARIEAGRLLAARLQEEEREMFTVKEKAKFLYDTIAAQRRSDKDFIAIGSAEDERQIKELNEESKDPKKKRVFNETSREDDTAKVPAEQEVTEQGTKKRKVVITIDSEIMETKSFVSKLHKVSSPDGDYLVVYRVNGHFRAFNYLMEVLHIFDRQDLFHLYDLVMKQYSEITPEGIELILWGDLKIMMESSTEENDQELKDGTVIYMLVERRYPLSKELLQRMLDLGLEVEEESTAALHLVRYIKQHLNEE
ncbi:hypothetical protein Tco_0296210 [Tanacetum coccineum]